MTVDVWRHLSHLWKINHMHLPLCGFTPRIPCSAFRVAPNLIQQPFIDRVYFSGSPISLSRRRGALLCHCRGPLVMYQVLGKDEQCPHIARAHIPADENPGSFITNLCSNETGISSFPHLQSYPNSASCGVIELHDSTLIPTSLPTALALSSAPIPGMQPLGNPTAHDNGRDRIDEILRSVERTAIKRQHVVPEDQRRRQAIRTCRRCGKATCPGNSDILKCLLPCKVPCQLCGLTEVGCTMVENASISRS